jgi:hypothetical protein
MSVITESTTLSTLPNGTQLALDVVGTPAAPTTGDGIPYSKIDVGAAGASSPVTASNPMPTRDLKDTGRTYITITLDATGGITSEALATALSVNKGGTNTINQTSYTVTSGKTLRVIFLGSSVKNTTTTAVNSRLRLRTAATVSATSPIAIANEAGSATAVANMTATDDTAIPEGLEIAGGQQIGISHIETSSSSTVSCCLIGYEY